MNNYNKTITVDGVELSFMDLLISWGYGSFYEETIEETLYETDRLVRGEDGALDVDSTSEFLVDKLGELIGKEARLVLIQSESHVHDIYKDEDNNYYGLYGNINLYDGSRDHGIIERLSHKDISWVEKSEIYMLLEKHGVKDEFFKWLSLLW